MKKVFLLLGAVLLGTACQQEAGSPRPRGYIRIALPAQDYDTLRTDCPFTFEKNTAARYRPQKGYCWADIRYPSLKANVQLTYKDLRKHPLDSLLQDAYQLAYKHTVAADGIEEKLYLHPEEQVYGVLFRMSGNAASNAQFYLTDSSRHFLRGVLHFRASPNADSLRPAAQFVTEEMVHIMETLQWKNL